jgi:hypothetical protein
MVRRRGERPDLDADRIVETVAALGRRIDERFPGSGLGAVCASLWWTARQAKERSERIQRPILLLRVGVMALLVLVAAGLAATILSLELPRHGLDLADFIQVLEAGINDVVLIGAAVFFLVTVEARVKRRRGLDAIHELRSVAHVIDMHQLTKDPERVMSKPDRTASSPAGVMSPEQLGRYLNYCSEMLSLTGKVAAVYIRDFQDPVVLTAVNEVEDLTTALSRKIWQKLMVLHRAHA